jgi:rubrerythrin
MNEPDPKPPETQVRETPIPKKRIYICDRCGVEMSERNCKIICPNCGNRFDCSDLNIYFDS